MHSLPVHSGPRGDRLGDQKAIDISLFHASTSEPVSKKTKTRTEKTSSANNDDDGDDGVHKEPDDANEIDPGCPNVSSRDVNEADNAVRKHYRIKVSGYDPSPPLRSFKQMVTKHAVPSGLVRMLQQCGFDQPTPIQRQAVPALLAGRELLAVAPTGSGKTLVSVDQ